MIGVVVGVGRGAAESGEPVRWAAEEAALRGLPLRVVHAWDAAVSLSAQLSSDDVPDLVGTATSHAVFGRPVDVLLAQRADLLVLGRQADARHLPHLASTCLHHASCPVILVPHSPAPHNSRVVVGVCGTDASQTALRWAADEARRRLSTLVVVYAWQLRPGSAHDLLRPAKAVPGQQSAALNRLRVWVECVLGTVPAELHASHGAPLDELLDAGAAADLLVLGRSVHAGLAGVLHGSIDADLAAIAPVPVAIIPNQTPGDNGARHVTWYERAGMARSRSASDAVRRPGIPVV
jgi:nucleotide-binding universal stress UspA family protein